MKFREMEENKKDIFLYFVELVPIYHNLIHLIELETWIEWVRTYVQSITIGELLALSIVSLPMGHVLFSL